MSDYRLDDELLLAVRAARPEVDEEAVSLNSAAAKATLERVLNSDPRRRDVGVLDPVSRVDGRAVLARGTGHGGYGSILSCRL